MNRNSIMSIKKRVLWGELFLKLVSERTVFVYIDETGFNRSMNRNYGRSLVNKAPNIVNEKTKSPNISCIAALAVGYGCYNELIEGPCNGERFVQFCSNCIDWLLRKIPHIHQICVVMDNAKIHLSDVHSLFWEKHCFLLKTIARVLVVP